MPVGPLWQYEIKSDGYRLQAHANAGQVRLFTKSGLDYVGRLPRIAAAIAALGRNVVLDGGAVVDDVEYRGWTPSGELRHPVLKGWHREG